MMLKTCLFIVALVVITPLKAQDSFDLAQAITYGIKNGYSVQNAATDIELAQKRAAEIRGIGIPQVNAEAGYQNFLQVPVSVIEANAFNPQAPQGTYLRIPFGVKHNMSYGFTASWLAFNGEYLVAVQANKAFLELSKSGLRKSEIEIKESITRAYHTVLVLNENKRLIQDNLKALDQSITETEAYYKEGFIEELDLDRLKLLRKNLGTALSTLEQQTLIAEQFLKFSMGYDVNAPIKLTEKIEDRIAQASTGVDEVPAFQPDANIDNVMLRQAMTLQKFEIKRQKAAFLPTFSTYYTWRESRITNEGDKLFDPLFKVPGGTIIGLNLSVPVFKGLSQRARLQQAELNFKKLETSQKQAQQGLALQSSQSFIAYKASLNAFQQSKESVLLAQRIRDRARIKFKEGVGSSVELLQAENEFLSAQGLYLEAMRQLMDNRVSLDKNLNKF